MIGTAPLHTLYHVYILQSQSHPDHYYIGFTEHLAERIAEHNRGHHHYTASHRPWRIKTVISFAEEKRARDFER
ncbi:GIY-YIG nuclease family protein, partial [bacterium]|nr:GIY-YIG nuclease family protein [bacterium]